MFIIAWHNEPECGSSKCESWENSSYEISREQLSINSRAQRVINELRCCTGTYRVLLHPEQECSVLVVIAFNAFVQWVNYVWDERPSQERQDIELI